MKWIRIEGSTIKVYGKQGKLLPKGMAEEHTAFLHNLLTNDIKGMKENTLTYNLWLRQNGFPIGEFYVYKIRDFYLLDTPLEGKTVVEEFSRLKLSMRVYFELLNVEHVFIFDEGARDFIKSHFGVELKDGEVVELEGTIVASNPIRIREEGYDIFGNGLPLKEEDEISQEDFEDLRIKRLIPKLGKELREGFSPLESCVLKHAISLTKGCYVGQEAIARVYYRGRLPRLLALFEGEGISEGEKIRLEDKDIGLITSTSPKGGFALGYILRAKLENQSIFKTDKGKTLKVVKLCEDQ